MQENLGVKGCPYHGNLYIVMQDPPNLYNGGTPVTVSFDSNWGDPV